MALSILPSTARNFHPFSEICIVDFFSFETVLVLSNISAATAAGLIDLRQEAKGCNFATRTLIITITILLCCCRPPSHRINDTLCDAKLPPQFHVKHWEMGFTNVQKLFCSKFHQLRQNTQNAAQC
jgi:hypothetical protein